MAKTLMVLDCVNMLYRAFFGVAPLTTRDGTPTQAIYGFLNMTRSLLDTYRPDALCAAFDTSAPTFRSALYEGYKGDRTPMEDALAAQLHPHREALAALRIPVYELDGYEADDLMGTMSRICADAGWDCLLVSGDRDLYQLIGDTVRVVHLSKHRNTLMDTAAIREEYGLDPSQLLDLKALMGDASDRIPGVPGVGEKTALLLMREYGSLDDIYQRLGEVPEKYRKKLEPAKETAYLSKDLGRIVRDAPITFRPEDALRRPPDAGLLRGVFDRLEFKNMLNKWLSDDARNESGKTGVSLSQPDTDGNGVRDARNESGKTGVSLPQPEPDETGVRDARNESGKTGVSLPQPEPDETGVRDAPEGVGRDVKGVWRADIEAGRPPSPFEYDAPLAAWVLGKSETAWDDMRSRMEAEGVWELYRDVEMPLCMVLARMETSGVAVDRAKLAGFSGLLDTRLDGCKRRAAELLDREVNLLSPKQLGELLFEELKLPHGKKNKTGWSTDADTLEKLREAHPIVPLILETRMLSKLKSTYADGLLKASETDGKIHSTFQMTATVTGRLSSTEPNLQNIPVRQELGARLREMFVPSEQGWVFVDADYSQIELRVLAHIAGDETMRAAFASGLDIHAATASQVFGVPLSDVTPAMRRNAKAVNFGIVYGISDFSLADDIGVARAEAKAYIDSYLGKYAGVREYMRSVVEKARSDGFVTTLFGRRRYIPEVYSKNYHIRSFGERAAMNAPIQGTAADIIKMAMVAVAGRFERENLRARLVLQVHDELIAECPEDEAETVRRLLREEMEGVYALNPVLSADAHTGKNWADAKG